MNQARPAATDGDSATPPRRSGGGRAAEAPADSGTEAGRPGAPPLRSGWQRLAVRLEGGICEVGEPQESRLRKVQFTLASMLVVPAGVVWGVLFLAVGEATAAMFPLAYAAITLLGTGLLLWTGRFERFRIAQQISIFVLPIALHVELGGFVGSGAVILWSFLAILMALLFGGDREARVWFGAFALAVFGVTLLRPSLAVENSLPAAMVLAFFALNLTTVALVVFAVLHSFLADRRKLRQLEVAYLEQELMLRQSEKLATLGTLAAGMAHELNNPAAAASRSVADLRAVVEDLHRSYLEAAAALSPDRATAIRRARAMLRAPPDPPHLSPLESTEREEHIEDWLDEVGLDVAGAPGVEVLVGRGFTRTDLEEATADLSEPARRLFVACVLRACATDDLFDEVEGSVARVSGIVEAIRSYAFLDQGPVQEVDLVAGIENTLLVLRAGLDGRVRVARELQPLPRIPGHGSELNQVWTHLVQNALDAMEGEGILTLRAWHSDGEVVVEVEDSGPGMPPEVAVRVFDPFFTTKPPGGGAGLGLTVSHNIVRQHGGRITVASEPGRTVFAVMLPVAAGDDGGMRTRPRAAELAGGSPGPRVRAHP